MSCSTSICYGYGFELGFLNKTKFIEFIKNHKNSFCKSEAEKILYKNIQEYIKYDLEDFFENYECENTGEAGIGAVISNIMTRETGIRFDYRAGQDDCGSEPTIMFPDTLPWFLNDKEKELTAETLSEICNKYISEIGTSFKPNFVSVEYFG